MSGVEERKLNKMNAIDYVIIGVVAAVIVLAVIYVIKTKKSGKKCIGCPTSKGGSCNGSCSDCPSAKNH